MQYRIYGKHGTQKQFKAMDLSRGIQVGNLIYASILSEEEKDKFMAQDAPKNQDWIFETRPIPTKQQL